MPDGINATSQSAEVDSCGCCVKPPTTTADLIRDLEERQQLLSHRLRRLESSLSMAGSR